MKYNEVIKRIQNENCAAVAINQKEKEIFIIDFDKDPDRFEEIIVWYNQEDEVGSGTEDSFSIDEFLEEFPKAKELDFRLISKDGMEALNCEFDEAIQIINRSLIKQ